MFGWFTVLACNNPGLVKLKILGRVSCGVATERRRWASNCDHHDSGIMKNILDQKVLERWKHSDGWTQAIEVSCDEFLLAWSHLDSVSNEQFNKYEVLSKSHLDWVPSEFCIVPYFWFSIVD